MLIGIHVEPSFFWNSARVLIYRNQNLNWQSFIVFCEVTYS